MMLLALDLIRTDGGKQTRTTTNITQANGCVEDMAAGAVCPLVDVFFDGSDYWLADGFHRLIACRSLGLAEIEVEVHDGSRHDAILYAVRPNAVRGLRRTNDDKHNAVRTLLKDPERLQWSDREIVRPRRSPHSFSWRGSNAGEDLAPGTAGCRISGGGGPA
jgi:hypothetical protein